jgi:hypothetical protein
MDRPNYPDRKELRDALKWWRAQHPEHLPVRPIKHAFFGWVLWGNVGEAGPVCRVMDAVKEYREANTPITALREAVQQWKDRN